MKVLVTGAQGFIGARLCQLLGEDGSSVVQFTGDVTQPRTFPAGPFDVVIHLAAKITHRGDFKDGDIHRTNVGGTENLLDFYPDAKFVYISTTDVTRKDLSFYARTKLEAERLVGRDKENLIIRLPSIFGPHQVQDKLIPRLIRHYYSGQRCEITDDSLREYLFLDDACAGIIDNLSSAGLVTLGGLKIRNSRLNDLIGNIHAGREMADLSADESGLRSQLKICCEKFDGAVK